MNASIKISGTKDIEIKNVSEEFVNEIIERYNFYLLEKRTQRNKVSRDNLNNINNINGVFKFS